MILFFHFLCLLARYIVSNFSKSSSVSKPKSADGLKEENVKQSMCERRVLKFFPPVYVQRYETVALILQDPQWKGKIRKVADFGCAELGLFMYLKSIEGLHEILEIDINKDVIDRCSYKAAPLATDHLGSRAVKPLEVYILAGSVADFDDYLIGTDAVIGIELIEHLSEEALKKMPYNVFNLIKPKLAIFTTPNADFNALFPELQKFRHPDHKFEWTRKEFFNWTQEIIKKYPDYVVKFYGIGAGPEGTENLGCCSQMAVFQKSEDLEYFSSAREKCARIENYKLVKHYSYPVQVDMRTREQKITHEIQYQVHYINAMSEYYNCNDGLCEVPLNLVKKYVDELCPDEEELINVLKNNGIKMKHVNDSWFILPADSDSDSSDENLSLDMDSSIEGTVKSNEIPNKLHVEEDWDLDDDELHLDDLSNFQSARSLDDFEEDLTPKKRDRGVGSKVKVFSDGFIKDETVSGSISCSPIIKQFGSQSRDSSTHRSKDGEGKRSLGRSKIPRKKFRGAEEFSPRVKQRMSVSCVRKPLEKISKSCSLDSCLENVNSTQSDLDGMAYLNLIPGDSVAFRKFSSSSSGRSKFPTNNSGSSLLSSSPDKAVDSGYPLSYSPSGFDLTTEQVDDVFAENVSSRSSSSLSEDGGVDYQNQRVVHDVFLEDMAVENGDLANNNRDREGNNVEGQIEQ